MKALVYERGVLRVVDRPVPHPAPDEVVIRVMRAGICRTDVLVMRGAIPANEPIVPGHEFVGDVIACGDNAHIPMGTRVTAMPMLPCGTCNACALDIATTQCPREGFLGVNRDGAFARFVALPAHRVKLLPTARPLEHGAYVEPVAAAMAVLNAPIRATQRGVVWGMNRIATLTLRVLRAHGFAHVVQRDASHTLDDDAFDFAIESQLDTGALNTLVKALRPGGVLVLKSRVPGSVQLDPSALVRKDLSLVARRYGSFDQAITALASRTIEIDDLLGETFPLAHFEAALAANDRGEHAKVFLDPWKD